jgi:hypothetical protein
MASRTGTWTRTDERGPGGTHLERSRQCIRGERTCANPNSGRSNEPKAHILLKECGTIDQPDETPNLEIEPVEYELSFDPFSSHGSFCRCRTSTRLEELPMAHSLRVEIARHFGRHPAAIRIGEILGRLGIGLPKQAKHGLNLAAVRWAAEGCPYDGGDSPTLGWGRGVGSTGRSGREFPNDWQAEDWSWWSTMPEPDCEIARLKFKFVVPTLVPRDSDLMSLLDRHWYIGYAGESGDD